MSQDTSFLDRVIATYADSATDRHYGEEQWPAIVGCAEICLSLLEARPPGRLLDLACGCGSATAAMALKGFDLTGIDCTPSRVDVARRMAPLRGASVQWLCQDMRLIDYREEFDYVCLRDVIFGIFETRQEDLDLLRRMAMALKPGGRCLLEVYNKSFALQHGVEGYLFHDPAEDRFVPLNAVPGKLSGMRLYFPHEWSQMLEGQGLRILKTDDGWRWPNDPPAPPWRADFIVAQKQARNGKG